MKGSHTCEFIKLEAKGDGKEEELVAYRDEERYDQVVVVQDVDCVGRHLDLVYPT